MIVDYSTLRPTIAALQASRITAAGRYIGWDCEPGYGCIGKNITLPEAHQLISSGIAVFLAFEYAADAMTGGHAQGAADGDLAFRQLATLGAPPGMTVYFAADFDIPDYAPGLTATPWNAAAKLGPAASYLRAAAATLGPTYKTGIYGGYYAVSRALDAGLAAAGWQTVAWSGGQRDPRAVLYQLSGTVPLAGADVDVHESTTPDFGQWPRPQTPPPPSQEDAMLIVHVQGHPEVYVWNGTTMSHVTSEDNLAQFKGAGLASVEVTADQFAAMAGAPALPASG